MSSLKPEFILKLFHPDSHKVWFGTAVFIEFFAAVFLPIFMHANTAIFIALFVIYKLPSIFLLLALK